MKIGIVGAGQVGAACVYATIMRGFAREIVLVNKTRDKAKGVVADMRYGALLSPETALREGDYAELKGADVVMVTVGVNEKTGGATDGSKQNKSVGMNLPSHSCAGKNSCKGQGGCAAS